MKIHVTTPIISEDSNGATDFNSYVLVLNLVSILLHFLELVFEFVLQSDNLIKRPEPGIFDLLSFSEEVVNSVFGCYRKLMFMSAWFGHRVTTTVYCNDFLKRAR